MADLFYAFVLLLAQVGEPFHSVFEVENLFFLDEFQYVNRLEILLFLHLTHKFRDGFHPPTLM